ncbi:dnaJ homolog subfamily C member 4-like isoform X2 [Lampetra planeri]
MPPNPPAVRAPCRGGDRRRRDTEGLRGASARGSPVLWRSSSSGKRRHPGECELLTSSSCTLGDFVRRSAMQVYLQESVCRACLRHSPRRSLYTSRMCRQSHYEVLGVASNASMEQIKAAFFQLSKQLHPDRNPCDPELHGRFVKLNEAYMVLSKPVTRHQYDIGLHLSQAATSQPGGRAPKTWPFQSPGFTEKQRYAQSAEWERDRMYWEQFRPPNPEQSAFTHSKSYQRRSRLIVGGCLLFICLSMGLHYLGYRVNGVEKQNEILRQKYTEFVAKHRKEENCRVE